MPEREEGVRIKYEMSVTIPPSILGVIGVEGVKALMSATSGHQLQQQSQPQLPPAPPPPLMLPPSESYVDPQAYAVPQLQQSEYDYSAPQPPVDYNEPQLPPTEPQLPPTDPQSFEGVMQGSNLLSSIKAWRSPVLVGAKIGLFAFVLLFGFLERERVRKLIQSRIQDNVEVESVSTESAPPSNPNAIKRVEPEEAPPPSDSESSESKEGRLSKPQLIELLTPKGK